MKKQLVLTKKNDDYILSMKDDVNRNINIVNKVVNGEDPVSYTHLDVYKRQVWKIGCMSVHILQFQSLSLLILSALSKLLMVEFKLVETNLSQDIMLIVDARIFYGCASKFNLCIQFCFRLHHFFVML